MDVLGAGVISYEQGTPLNPKPYNLNARSQRRADDVIDQKHIDLHIIKVHCEANPICTSTTDVYRQVSILEQIYGIGGVWPPKGLPARAV